MIYRDVQSYDRIPVSCDPGTPAGSHALFRWFCSELTDLQADLCAIVARRRHLHIGVAELHALIEEVCTPESIEAHRLLRLIFRKLAQLFVLGELEPEMTYRSDGAALCERCGAPHSMHPEHPHARWLTMLCDGRRVKL